MTTPSFVEIRTVQITQAAVTETGTIAIGTRHISQVGSGKAGTGHITLANGSTHNTKENYDELLRLLGL